MRSRSLAAFTFAVAAPVLTASAAAHAQGAEGGSNGTSPPSDASGGAGAAPSDTSPTSANATPSSDTSATTSTATSTATGASPSDAPISPDLIVGAQEVEAAPASSKLRMSMPGVGYVGGEIPKGMHLERHGDTSLVWVGLGMFALSYAPPAGVGGYVLATKPSDAELATEGRNERRLKKTLPLMLIPFAGPVIGAGALMDAVIHPPDHAPAITVILGTVGAAACMVDAAVQVVSVVVTTKGLVSSHEYLVPDEPAQGKLRLTPWSTTTAGGLQLSLTL